MYIHFRIRIMDHPLNQNWDNYLQWIITISFWVVWQIYFIKEKTTWNISFIKSQHANEMLHVTADSIPREIRAQDSHRPLKLSIIFLTLQRTSTHCIYIILIILNAPVYLIRFYWHSFFWVSFELRSDDCLSWK